MDSSSATRSPQPTEASPPGVGAGVMAPLPPIQQHRKLTPAERAAEGKAARKRVPRRSHAAWQPAADRPDPIELLEQQAAERSQDLVPIRYGRMAASPFAFYRGGALLMASDLASTPDSGLVAQLCGDAHLMNFGLFESPERRLVFDINDFDETLPGPWEWDVKRLATSFEVGGRDRGFDATVRRRIVMDCVLHYRVAMIEMAALRAIDVWYARLDADLIREQSKTLGGSDSRQVAKDLSSASGKDSLRAFSRLTQIVDGGAALPERSTSARPGRGAPHRRRAREIRDRHRDGAPHLPRKSAPRSAASLRSLPLPRDRAQGRGRRQRRHACLGDAVLRTRCRRPRVLASQDGAGLRP